MLRIPVLRCVAEIGCCAGVYHGCKQAALRYTIPAPAPGARAGTEKGGGWGEEALTAGLRDRKLLGAAEAGSSVAAMLAYAAFATRHGGAGLVTKVPRPEWRAVTLISLLCLNYGTAKLAYNVQTVKENLVMAPQDRPPLHFTQRAIASVFELDSGRMQRNTDINISTCLVQTFVQPIVEGILVHKYLYLRMLPIVGPAGAAVGTAAAYALVHRDPFSSSGGAAAIDAADSMLLQAVFVLTKGSAAASIIGHILANMIGVGVSTSEQMQWFRFEEQFWYRFSLYTTGIRKLNWYSCIVPKGAGKEAIHLNLLPPVPRTVQNPQCTIDKKTINTLCSRLFQCYKQPGAARLSPDDVADLIYAFRTGAHVRQLAKFEQLGKSACVLGLGISRTGPRYRLALPAVLCSDQAYLEAHNRYPKGMDLSGLINFVYYELFIGYNALTSKQLTEFLTRRDLEALCAPNGPLCRWCVLPSPGDEAAAVRQVDDYYKEIRASLLDVSSLLLNNASDLDQEACEMPNIESVLEGLSRTPSASNDVGGRGVNSSANQSDEEYYCDTLNIYARRASLAHLQRQGYTVRRWRLIMEKMEEEYPNIETLRHDWHAYFNSPEFKYVMMNSPPPARKTN
jgi:hypothetical protein